MFNLILKIKNVANEQKRVNVRFFHEKSETLKKIFFIKVPKNGQIGKLLLLIPSWNEK